MQMNEQKLIHRVELKVPTVTSWALSIGFALGAMYAFWSVNAVRNECRSVQNELPKNALVRINSNH